MKHQTTILIPLAVCLFLAQPDRAQGRPEQPNTPSLQLPRFAGQFDTNIFNTNGLVLPEDVRLLIHDLRVNMSQLIPLLAIVNGENPTNAAGAVQSGQNVGQISGTLLGAPSAPPGSSPAQGSSGTNGTALVYALGAVLEDVQADLQELLPRLANVAGQTNYSNKAAARPGGRTPSARATSAPSPAPPGP